MKHINQLNPFQNQLHEYMGLTCAPETFQRSAWPGNYQFTVVREMAEN